MEYIFATIIKEKLAQLINQKNQLKKNNRELKKRVAELENKGFNFVPKCHYCNGVPTKEMPLFSMWAPGTYFQHWDFNTQSGCHKNNHNISPSGQRCNHG